jgi:hypothetical protein
MIVINADVDFTSVTARATVHTATLIFSIRLSVIKSCIFLFDLRESED